jgi:serine/threonine protein kinase
VERGELIAGRYELVKRLGRGGMGEVWAARDRTLHRDVALKLLDLDGAVHPDLPQRFEREAVAAAQINHPNVVALYDRGIHEDLLFLVMEKVEGATLTEHIHAETPMSLATALELASGICSALVAAHGAKVIHYDIKPHNVMLTPDGRVKVVDFGIAGFIQTAFTLARSSELTPAGTPEYGAPEQFGTERGDERSDLYALGGVLFALLTGRPPFTGHHAMAIVRRKLDEDAPRLDSLRPELPPALSQLVAELLDRDPKRRPASARQVHERLRHIWASVDATAPSPAADFAAGSAEPEHVAAPPGPTRRLPEDPSPVGVSWTGKDPVPVQPAGVRVVLAETAVPVSSVSQPGSDQRKPKRGTVATRAAAVMLVAAAAAWQLLAYFSINPNPFSAKAGDCIRADRAAVTQGEFADSARRVGCSSFLANYKVIAAIKQGTVSWYCDGVVGFDREKGSVIHDFHTHLDTELCVMPK